MTWLWMAAALGGFAQSLSGAAGALLAARIAGSPAVAGLPQTALVLGAALAALLLSALTRRVGRTHALATGALTAAAGCALVLLAAHRGSLPLVLLGTLLSGAGNTAVMLTRYAAAELAGTMTAVLTATAAGAITGPLLLGLADPYLVATAGFVLAAVCYLPVRVRVRSVVEEPTGPSGRPSRKGLAVLTFANLVMVGVMTLAPVHLAHGGAGPTAIGAVISAHIAGMFAPSLLSTRLVAAAGPGRTALLGTAILLIACLAVASGATEGLVAGLFLLGVGWNCCLVAGSTLLVADVPAPDRPRREAWGELGMGAAAATGGGLSGPLAATAGYPTLAWIGAALALTFAVVVLNLKPGSGAGSRRPASRRRDGGFVRTR
ncbi:MFS transporter [Dactylosporangium sp. CS-033363]|uniref:MFS transporter n=1 Tax=Dactylosporangium sp. CS-033363 TaxID=3239935 RepID=UPI003D913B6C